MAILGLESISDERVYKIIQCIKSNILNQKGTVHVVAFSGGVDSSLVASILYYAFTSSAYCAIGVSSSLTLEQLVTARDIAKFIGIPLIEVETTEGNISNYVDNIGNSCYYCKTTLYSTIQTLSSNIESAIHDISKDCSNILIYNGTNLDDVSDSTRTGILAAREANVISPLENLKKSEIREIALHIGLPNWDLAASPCLRSRLQYGVMATKENLNRVGTAESFIRKELCVKPTENLRVRHIEKDTAIVELDPLYITNLDNLDNIDARGKIISKLKELGYNEVIFRNFLSGSLSNNATSV